jgi:hypothetical protein
VARRSKAREHDRGAPAPGPAEVTVWPSSFPEGIGSLDDGDDDLARDCDELGNRFLADAVEQSRSGHPHWEEPASEDEPYFDLKMGDALLRSFGLEPMHKRSTTRPIAGARVTVPKLAAPRLPRDLEEYITPSDELDLTEESVRDVSMLDHEADEAGEVESPHLRTDDVHTHGKRRGGHARTSLRPPKR